MRLLAEEVPGGVRYTLYKERTPIGGALLYGGHIAELAIVPQWRRRGYGSYLLRELLRQNGGFERGRASTFTAPLPEPDDPAAWALAARFGFAAGSGQLLRRRVPDLSAVLLVHSALEQALRDRTGPGCFCLDATCGNGHDTLFLCRLAGPGGRVLGLDIQPQAVANTNALLAKHGMTGIGRALCADHRSLLQYAPPGTADCVLFNFGWLPGADHQIHSTAEGSVPALAAALEALKPGGVLAAVLYSGRVIGSSEKQAALDFFRTLPLTRYTVMVCSFANWADTAPLPCLVLKKEGG